MNGFLDYICHKLYLCDMYLVFDRCYEYSIKSGTRNSRAGERATRRHKIALTTPLPAQQVILTVTENKVQVRDLIFQQLLERVHNRQPTDIAFGHRLVVTGPDPVPRDVHMGVLLERTDMRATHEGAYVIMPQQITCLATQGCRCIKVVCDDTDVFILLVYLYHIQNLTCSVIMETTSPQRSSVDVGATAKKHANIVPHLLAANALSGCDTVAYMFGIGKGPYWRYSRKDTHSNILATKQQIWTK